MLCGQFSGFHHSAVFFWLCSVLRFISPLQENKVVKDQQKLYVDYDIIKVRYCRRLSDMKRASLNVFQSAVLQNKNDAFS